MEPARNSPSPAGALPARLGRLATLLGETRRRHGTIAAATLLARLLHHKLPLLRRQLATRWRTRTLRRELRNRHGAFPPDLPRIAVAVTGGVGDFIVVARFLRDLSAASGELAIDVFSPAPERAAWAFAAVPGFAHAYHDILFGPMMAEYDVALGVHQMAVVYREAVRWPALRERPRLVQALDTLVRARPKLDPFVTHHPFMDNFMAQGAVFAGHTRRDYLHHMAGLAYGGDRLPVPSDTAAVARAGLTPGAYVTVHNGFDTNFVIAGSRATKCYPHFGAVVAALQSALPHLAFVQVGAPETSIRLAECDVDLVGRTSLREVAGILANAAFHIDNESGLVHLARCYGVRAGVVFGPTPSDYFAYPDNVAIEPPVCGRCWWLTRTWMDACAKGYAAPRCMTEQDPQGVAARLLAAMQAQGLGAAPAEDGPARFSAVA